ncbi:type III secretion protein [Salmonella enterica]|uniref:Type III secretion protein n=2 Tax=Salmonella enterica TaxID=28901 RepID=A0A3V4IUE2_SALER|nr:type III secretion protein [Salmonella enterica]EBE1547095.1 type III secretion protein [Salmonella enterica subsp. enterica]ECC9158954.1 type III secretion protein [Salmonella enterica subsp. salamae]EDU6435584.1 type III secretion protein [Salmonella enterica subsp. salamae serovar 47:b:e,n,x,z15]HCM1851363.1 type III secretion protein [Salmonella enterica subsp. salamae serovar 42:z29:-]AZT23116.1 type III secretion protein [Salmonella enterica subsp. salamae serovar 42:r:-]
MILNRILSLRKNRLTRLRKLNTSIDARRSELYAKLSECNDLITQVTVDKKVYCDSLSATNTVLLFEYQKKNSLFDGRRQQLIEDKKKINEEILRLSEKIDRLRIDIFNVNKSIEKITYALKENYFE